MRKTFKTILFLGILITALHSSARDFVYKDSSIQRNLFMFINVGDEEFRYNLNEIQYYLDSIPKPKQSYADSYYPEYTFVQLKIYRFRGLYAQYITQAEKTISEAEKVGAKDRVVGLYGGLYQSYVELGLFDKALEYFKIWSKNVDQKTGNFNVLGTFYYRLGKYELALQNFKDILSTVEKDIEDDYYAGFLFNNIGQTYFKLNQPDSALFYYNLSLDSYIKARYYDKHTIEYLTGFNSFNKGEVYFEKGQFSIAKSFFEIGYANSNQKDFALLIKSLVKSIECTIELQDLKLLDTDVERITKYLTDEHINNTERLMVFGLLGKAYEALSEFKKSSTYLTKYIALEKEINSTRGAKSKYDQFAVLMGLEDKERQLQAQRIELLEKVNIESENQNLKVISISAIAILILSGASIVVILRLQKKLKIRTAREKDLAKIELIQKDTMLKEVHHRVKNNLQLISGVLQLQSNSSKDKELQIALAEGISRIQAVSELHDVIYQGNYNKKVGSRDYLNKIITYNQMFFNKDVEIKAEIKNANLSAEQAQSLGIILNELLTNTSKHAFTNRDSGNIKISFKQDGNCFSFYYQDNGIGIIKTPSTTSLGYKLVQMMTKKINGTYSQKSDSGVKIKIKFAV